MPTSVRIQQKRWEDDQVCTTCWEGQEQPSGDLSMVPLYGASQTPWVLPLRSLVFKGSFNLHQTTSQKIHIVKQSQWKRQQSTVVPFEWPHVPIHPDRDHSLRSGHWRVRKSPRHGDHWDTLFNIKLSLRKGRVKASVSEWPLVSAPIIWLARNVIKWSSFSPLCVKGKTLSADQNGQKQGAWDPTAHILNFPTVVSYTWISSLHRKMSNHVCRLQ